MDKPTSLDMMMLARVQSPLKDTKTEREGGYQNSEIRIVEEEESVPDLPSPMLMQMRREYQYTESNSYEDQERVSELHITS